jgi:hypothetical protein
LGANVGNIFGTSYDVYNWSVRPTTGGGFSSTTATSETTITITPTEPGTYTYSVTGITGVCTSIPEASTNVTVIVYPQPNVNDIVIVEDDVIYKKVYSSTSYTHDIDSNLPPRNEVYKFFNEIVENVKYKFTKDTPKKIYISRRSWIHNDTSNIGTNYTLRRKMVNEDELVEILNEDGYVEVFTENLTTFEKLNLFYNATNIIGAIGGGICNVLFSKPETLLLTIVSPTFLDVNGRFRYSLDNVNTKYFLDTNHTCIGEFKKHMRINCESLNIIGEIQSIDDDILTIIYSDETVSGWSSQNNFKEIKIEKSICKTLDNGLNSPFKVNLSKLISII